jgi:hypothetical protein
VKKETKKLSKKELSHVKKMEKATHKLIEGFKKLTAEDKALISLGCVINGKSPVDWKEFVKHLKALEKACIKIIKKEDKK